MNEKSYDLSKEGLATWLAKFLGTTVVAQYMAHGYHWNVKGPEFTQFHDFFGEIYEDWSGEEDRIAEYIRIIGFDAPHDLNQFLMLACLDSKPCSGDPMEMAANLYEANLVLKNCVEDIFNIASAINMQGIADWAASRIDAHSKWNWKIGTTIGADSMQIQTMNLDMGKSKAEVLLEVVDNDNSGSLLELQPTPESIRTSLLAAGHLVPEEQDLAEALIEIADKYGKFDEDQTGIWADYHEPENNPYAEMGVKCGNCVLFRGGQECAVVAFKVDPEGYCRFAVLPEGSVDPSKAPKGKTPGDHEYLPGEFSGGAGAPAEMLDMSKIKKGKGPVTLQSESITADADYGGKCPPATQDIVLNIENRQNAIDNVGYGPLNPDEANTEFWQDKADRWNITPVEASKSICGNCVFFDRRPKTLDCIETGIAEGGSGEQSAWDAIDQAELGYCTALDFKCAASRTCNAWAAGGPVTEDVKKDAPVTATAGSKPAPKKDQIKGSDKNKKGSAAGAKKITFSKAVETSLRNKVKEHNDSVDAAGKKVSLSKLKAVYRRGAGAFSTSHRPDQNRASWSMARVNAFLHLVKSGSPKNPKYTTDNDLLPASHPKSSVTASGSTGLDSVYAESLLTVKIESPETYATPEDAIYAFTEYAGLGYEALPVFRAAWKRGVTEGEDPFTRASDLAINLYDSKDADLLPKQEKE
jgi:starvation-inducible DNA-binding protein